MDSYTWNMAISNLFDLTALLLVTVQLFILI